MKTDVITVSSEGTRVESALKQAEKVAAYKEMSPKGALHLRLLTEEMMGLMRSMTGAREGLFWIEDEDGVYSLHLQVNSRLSEETREKLLAVATTGKNESATPFAPMWTGVIMYGPLVMASPDITTWDQAEFTLSPNLEEIVLNGPTADEGTLGHVHTLTLDGKTFYPDYYLTDHGTHYLRLNVLEP